MPVLEWGCSSVGERFLGMEEVVGSTPISSTIFCFSLSALGVKPAWAASSGGFWSGVTSPACIRAGCDANKDSRAFFVSRLSKGIW